MAIATGDVYMWVVTYRDGTDVKEFDSPDSIGRGWAEVDHMKVKGLHLLPLHAGSMRSHVIAIPDDATPLFFRRRRAVFDLMSDEEGKPGGVAHCIGWKRVDQSVYLFIWEDGSSLLTEDLQAV